MGKQRAIRAGNNTKDGERRYKKKYGDYKTVRV